MGSGGANPVLEVKPVQEECEVDISVGAVDWVRAHYCAWVSPANNRSRTASVWAVVAGIASAGG